MHGVREVHEDVVEARTRALIRELRSVRLRQGLTQADVASVIGRSQDTVSRYEDEDSHGTEIRSIMRLCEGARICLLPIAAQRLNVPETAKEAGLV